MKSRLNKALLLVTLGVTPLSSYAQIIWDGDTNSNWSAGTNWLLDVAPVSGDALIFSGSTSITINNDLAAGASIAGITFDDSVNTSGNFTLAGNNILLTAGITSNSLETVNNTIALNMELDGSKFVNADLNNTVTIAGDISGTGAFFLNQGGGFEGTVVLSGDNSYSGLTRLQGGTLRITTSDSLGNGLIDIRDNGNYEPMVILDATEGDLTFTNNVRFHNTGTVKVLSVIGGNATIGGVQLDDAQADDGSIAVVGGKTLTVTGVVSGVGILNIDSDRTIDGRAVVGGGTVILQGNNTHTGGTLLEEGILRLEHDNALGTGTLTMEQRGSANPILVLDNGLTITNDLSISNTGGIKRVNLLGGTANAATLSGNIAVNETTAGSFDISSNSTGGDFSYNQILTISGDITSTAGAGVDIIGDGVVRLTGNNNITGTVNISNRGSKLRVGNDNALGTADVLINNRAAELQLEDGITIANDLTFTGVSNVTKQITVHDGNDGVAESATASGTILLQETSDLAVEFVAQTLDTLTLSGVISGGANNDWQKLGGGTVILTAINDYLGLTTVTAGTLQLGDGTSGNDGVIVGDIVNDSNLTYNTFGAGSYGGAISGTGSITKLGAGTQTLSGALQLGTAQQEFNVTFNGDSAPELTISGDIGADGERDLIKNGTGTLLLTGDNSAGAVVIAGVGDADFDGINRVRIKEGVVQIQQANNLGDNSIFISDGANVGTLEFVGSSATTIENEIALRGNAGTNTILRASGTTMAAAVEYSYGNLGQNGDTLTLDGANTGLNTIGFDLNANGNNLAGGLTKAGTGTWVLKAGVAQTYTGATTVSAGILMINGDSSLATGDVNVASGATLGGSGTIGGNTTIASGGFLNPGNSPGLMTFASDLTLAGTTTMEIDGVGRGTGFDAIDVSGLLTYGGALVFTADTAIAAGTYDLFGINGSEGDDFGSIVLSGAAYSNDALTNSGGGVWEISLGATTYTFTQGTGDLLVAVPEPGTFALIAGMLALASIAIRHRNRG